MEPVKSEGPVGASIRVPYQAGNAADVRTLLLVWSSVLSRTTGGGAVWPQQSLDSSVGSQDHNAMEDASATGNGTRAVLCPWVPSWSPWLWSEPGSCACMWQTPDRGIINASSSVAAIHRTNSLGTIFTDTPPPR